MVSETGHNEQIDDDIMQSRADILRASGQSNIQQAQTKPEDARQEKNEIPRFDLAEEIMAEQRKITAIKRKAPGKKIEAQKPEAKSIGYCLKQQRPTSPEQKQIIAEIVARDIERLCRGDGVNDY